MPKRMSRETAERRVREGGTVGVRLDAQDLAAVQDLQAFLGVGVSTAIRYIVKEWARNTSKQQAGA